MAFLKSPERLRPLETLALEPSMFGQNRDSVRPVLAAINRPFAIVDRYFEQTNFDKFVDGPSGRLPVGFRISMGSVMFKYLIFRQAKPKVLVIFATETSDIRYGSIEFIVQVFSHYKIAHNPNIRHNRHQTLV